MNIVEENQKITDRWGGLPNTEAVASFSYIDQLVLFRKIEAKDVLRNMEFKSSVDRWKLSKEMWLNAWHEYTHWLDMTSTVFGLQWMSRLALVHEGLSKGAEFLNGPAHLELCQQTTRALANIHLPPYYSTVEQQIGAPWGYVTTVGQAFDQDNEPAPYHPIWFVRFTTAAAPQTTIARQPLSVASLLEVRAVANEFLAMRSLLEAAPTKDFRIVEEAEFNREFMARLYSPDLTVYSVAAHWYANNRNITDVIEAYQASAYLAGFCLDAPPSWIASLKATNELREHLGTEFASAMDRSLARVDRGALFFMLALDQRLQGARTIKDDLERVLNENWKTGMRELHELSQVECWRAINTLRGIKVDGRLKKFLDAVSGNVRLKSHNQLLGIKHIDKLRLPAIILADGAPLDIFRQAVGDSAYRNKKLFDPTIHVEDMWAVSTEMENKGSYSPNGLQCFALSGC